MKQQALRYWAAMNASALQAAAHTGKAWLATAGAHAAVDSIPALSMPQFGAVLLFAFGMAILDWLDKNPIEIPEAPAPQPKLDVLH